LSARIADLGVLVGLIGQRGDDPVEAAQDLTVHPDQPGVPVRFGGSDELQCLSSVPCTPVSSSGSGGSGLCWG